MQKLIEQELRMMGYKTNNGKTLHIMKSHKNEEDFSNITRILPLTKNHYLELLDENVYSKSMFVVMTIKIDVELEDLPCVAEIIQSVCTDYEVVDF